MKIFYDGLIFTLQRYGGINTLFQALAEQLLKIDPATELRLFKYPQDQRLSNLYYMAKIGTLMRKIDALKITSSASRFKPDIYHTTYFRIPDPKPAKTVITIYDMIYEKYAASMAGSARIIKEKKKAIERADLVITISESTKRDILDYYGRSSKEVAVVYLAAGPEFSPAKEEEKKSFRDRYRLNKPYILYVGKRNGYKNFKLLLQTFSQWPGRREFDLVCAGGGAHWSDEEARIIGARDLTGRVKLFPALDIHSLRLFYAAARVFVYPSQYEGFGLPLLEAMQCQTPVIAANSSSLPEVLGEAGLYFELNNDAELLSCLEKICGDEGFRSAMVSKGTKRAGLFSWEKTAAETLNLYKKLLA